MSSSTTSPSSNSHTRSSLSEINMATQQITSSNDSTSRLLKLPPEIRNRIYHFLLGGHDVHVNLAQSSNWLYICQAPTKEDEVFEQHKTTQTAPRFLHQHSACEPAVEHHPLSEAISLPVLRTCRKIHHEASLMPFSSNTFIIRDLSRLSRFIQRLTPVQQRAVQHLEFITTEPERPPATTTAFRFEDYTGIRHLRVRMEIMRAVHEDALEEWAGWYWGEMMGQFAQKTLASAEVMVYRASGSPVMPVTRDWAERMEGKLLEVKEESEEVEGEVEAVVNMDEKTDSKLEEKTHKKADEKTTETTDEKIESKPEEKSPRKRKQVEEDDVVRQLKRVDLRANRGLRALKR
ncbi:hypothetical protein PRZ48_002601 [Zasmidium cellare]|uniref:DUF7730 domain-containing protein n=1 Tax=Zasmidium cellare TaxID=395010 RepID=A0ABR0ETP4_ZASCE|nr:hypothetical protein PRZ48_002601 [Zasmidium cellare]